MYTNSFGFLERPFSNTPDPKYFLQTGTHKEALSALVSGILQKKGFMVLTGDVGTGKTTLCRALLNQMGDTIDSALVLNSNLAPEEVLKAINRDLGLSPEGATRFQLMETLYEYLIERALVDRTVVIIIDDAQNLPPDSLEQVRMISNFETEKEKLVQILLVGQPELEAKLDTPAFRQVRQRIAVHPRLVPLSRPETGAYVLHRLSLAGGRPEKIRFTVGALRAIHRASGGYPRTINTLCDRVLTTALDLGVNVIDRWLIRSTSRALRLRPSFLERLARIPAMPSARWATVTLGTAACLLALIPWSGSARHGVLDTKMSSLERNLAGLQEQLARLEAARGGQVVEEQGLAEDLSAARREAEELRNQLLKKEEELKQLGVTLDRIQLRREAGEDDPQVEETISSLQRRESDLKAGVASLRSEAQNRAVRIEQMERALEELRQKLSMVEQEKESLARDLRQKEQQLASRASERDPGGTSAIDLLRAENERLREDQALMQKVASQTIRSQEDQIDRLNRQKEALAEALKYREAQGPMPTGATPAVLASP